MVVCMIFTTLLVLVLSACSSVSPEEQNGLRMLRDFAQIPADLPVTTDQAEISLESKLPLGSSKEDMLNYIDTRKRDHTYCYWGDDESKMDCSLVFNTKKPQSYVVTFIFGNNQRLREIQVYGWGPDFL